MAPSAALSSIYAVFPHGSARVSGSTLLKKHLRGFLACALVSLVLLSCSDSIGGSTVVSDYGDLRSVWIEMSQYTLDDSPRDHWKTAEEFEADGGGNEKDFAAYMVLKLGADAWYVEAGLCNHSLVTFVRYHDLNILPAEFMQYVKPEDLAVEIALPYNTVRHFCYDYARQ